MNVGSVKFVFDNSQYYNCTSKEVEINPVLIHLCEEEKIFDYLRLRLILWGSVLCKQIYGGYYPNWVTQIEEEYLRIEGFEAITVQQVLPALPRIPKAQVQQEQIFLLAVAEGGM